VQKHLRKCFDAIYRLEFATIEKENDLKKVKEIILTTDIIAMISPEGEKVPLEKGLKARGNVEDWLGKVEELMFVSLRKRMKVAINDLQLRGRELFLLAHPSQVSNYERIMNN
jgi:dynein heavy chain